MYLALCWEQITSWDKILIIPRNQEAYVKYFDNLLQVLGKFVSTLILYRCCP